MERKQGQVWEYYPNTKNQEQKEEEEEFKHVQEGEKLTNDKRARIS